MLASIERNLDLAQYEPLSIRPTDRWIGVRRGAAEEVGMLFGPLLLTGAKDLHFSTKITNRLSRLADGLDVVGEARSPACDGVVTLAEDQKQDLESAKLPFHNTIVGRLDRLEKALSLECERHRNTNYVSA